MKSDKVHLQIILDMIKRIEGATKNGKDAFRASQLHQDAVLRNLHTMTETTQRLSRTSGRRTGRCANSALVSAT